jgi:hypothetical protein
MKLPAARGVLSGAVLEALRTGRVPDPADVPDVAGLRVDPLTDDDFALALWVLYELHYLGFDGVDPDLEWDPALIGLRGSLERVFEAELRRRTDPHVQRALRAQGDVAERLFALTESFDGPSVATFIQREATVPQLAEFLVHRSIYHLKESDPASWVLPRISGKPKAALAELQYDEYGGGRPERLHATMFGDVLEACGLDREYGAYVDQVPGYTLTLTNAMSLLGLHRRLRAAAMGHLGAFEATSSLPCRRFAGGVRRLGLPQPAAAYFDEHVEADAVHEQVALRDICAGLVDQDPALLPDVFFGAAVCLDLDAVVGSLLLRAWRRGASTLRTVDAEAVAS